MRYQLLAVVAVIVFHVASAPAQTVTITGQKKVYSRAKPIVGFKKTFTIRRPVATAGSPELSRRITSTLDPVTVLGINVKEELTESQWLHEADFEEVFNEKGVLTMMIWMEGAGAYTDGVTKYVVVDIATGERSSVEKLFTDIPGLVAAVKKKQDIEVAEAIKTIKAEPEFGDGDPKQLFEYTGFEVKDLDNFAVDRAGVSFFYDYGFPNVLKALEPTGELRLSWAEIKPFIRQDGLLARFVS